MERSLDWILKYPHMRVRGVEDAHECLLIHGKMLINNTDITISLLQTTIVKGEYQYILQNIPNVSKTTIANIRNDLSSLKFKNTVEALDRIQDILEAGVSKKKLENYSQIYRTVLQEYSELTKFFFNFNSHKLSYDLSSINVDVKDSKLRIHSVGIKINYAEPTEIFQLADIDLPEGEAIHNNNSLVALFEEFIARIELLQPFFNLMEDFDRNTSILDPEKPRKCDAYRRIWLGENISVIITVDPFNIFQRPDIRFLGPEKSVEPYNTNFNNNFGNWALTENIFQAVLDLLGIEAFPKRETMKSATSLLVEYGECSICFSLRVDGKLPDIICENSCCAQFYHGKCLYEWLVCLNAKRTFNNVSGNCPNCEKIISCPILD
ncbi:E3 ubiquitin-protein ligase FANCL-like isoform X1 [Euwallacea fornicatus]|uniref:E3 ubiquitin-protein ligase FANCL-like isoform X1 n=1 Tax=Euwallacea fornicatus TaxID=995702 RepID=UPI00338F0770